MKRRGRAAHLRMICRGYVSSSDSTLIIDRSRTTFIALCSCSGVLPFSIDGKADWSFGDKYRLREWCAPLCQSPSKRAGHLRQQDLQATPIGGLRT